MIELVVLIVVLLAGSAFFAGSELAVTMASRVRLRTRAAEGERSARWAERLLRRRERTIAVCLVGNNLVNVALAVYGRELIARTVPMSEAWLDTVATALVVPIVLICGEIVPKAVSQSYPNRVLVAAAGALHATRVLLAPLLLVAVGIAELARRLVRARTRVLEFATREELKQFVVRSEVRGHVDSEERGLIHNIVEFWKLDPYTFVQPLESVTRIASDARLGDAKELMRKRRVTRLVVTDPEGTRVEGVVTAAGILSLDNTTPVSRALRRPVRFTLSHGLDRLLADLQRSPSQVAVVSDPEGPPGIILLDDLLRTLMGAGSATGAARVSSPRMGAGGQESA